MSDERLFFNGINGATGGPLLPAMTPAQLSSIVLGQEQEEQAEELEWWHDKITSPTLGPKEGVDPKDLAQAGWGVIFAQQDQGRVPALKEALGELLALRQAQAGEYYYEYTGPDAYGPAESKTGFLARHGMGPGPADPEKVPYYLLIVGDPATIPFSFQYQLDVQYAVGRIHFSTLDEYARYARCVVQAERGEMTRPRTATLFGVENDADRATQLSARELVLPLAEAMAQDQPEWEVRTLVGAGQATKATLGRLLGGDETPALLFTASHGLGFPPGDPRQLPHQGALLCQDWPGPAAHRGAIPPDHYFSADDLSASARLRALLSFHFACYGAGTPERETYGRRGRIPAAIAPHAFLSRLPQRLLGHPGGGALAVVGHVDRAWGYSYLWEGAGRQLAVFESTIKRLMEGHPVGSAFEYFDRRYAELSSDLSAELREIEAGRRVNERALAGMWTANNDARSYVVLGDPAVRLPVRDDGTVREPVLGPVTIVAESPREEPLPPDEAAPSPTEPGAEDERAGEVDFLYRARLVLARNEERAQQEIQDAIDEAIAEIDRLIDKHARLSKRRPGAEGKE